MYPILLYREIRPAHQLRRLSSADISANGPSGRTRHNEQTKKSQAILVLGSSITINIGRRAQVESDLKR